MKFDGMEAIDEATDYLPSAALDKIEELVAKLPPNGFDASFGQAYASGKVQVTLTVDRGDVFAAADQATAILRSATVLGTLARNLRRARAAEDRAAELLGQLVVIVGVSEGLADEGAYDSTQAEDVYAAALAWLEQKAGRP